METETIKQLKNFINKNPQMSITALWKISDVLYNLPDNVEINKVFPLDNGGVFTFIVTKSKLVCVHSDKNGNLSILDSNKNGNLSILDSNKNGKPEVRTWFNKTVPVNVVCAELIR